MLSGNGHVSSKNDMLSKDSNKDLGSPLTHEFTRSPSDTDEIQDKKNDRDFFDQVLRIASKSGTSRGKSVSKKQRTKTRAVKHKQPQKFDNTPAEYKRPTLSYNELIIEALKNSENGMLSLQEIYEYIQDNYLFFSHTTVAWQNSIRHNLSVQKMFERVPRPIHNPGKGGLWRIVPWVLESLPHTNQSSTKRRKAEPESTSTCVNSPQNPQTAFVVNNQRPFDHNIDEFFPSQQQEPMPESGGGKGNYLMDTLATLALSVETPAFQWSQRQCNDSNWQRHARIEHMQTFLESPFVYPKQQQPHVESSKEIAVMLDPVVGDKTLLQATFSDSPNHSII